MRWVCVLGLLLVLLHLSTSLLLGAFNIQTFGDKKSKDVTLMNYITKIVCRYDIILIQEVRDPDLSVTTRLMKAVSKECPKLVYKYVVSEPLGKTSYKERYLFLFRVGIVSVVRNYTYNDIPYGSYSRFSRPPFIVEFSSTHTAVGNFVLIPQHTSPSDAVLQIDALYDVATYVRNYWNTKNIVLLGDFNAGDNYVLSPRWKWIRLSADPWFHWLITNDKDTTVPRQGKTGFPYDRIVVTDDMMKNGVVTDSAKVYNYMLDVGLTEQQALDVSDHFPVEVKLIEKKVNKRKRKRKDLHGATEVPLTASATRRISALLDSGLQEEPPNTTIPNSTVSVVETFRFLGFTISQGLK
ncbi:deoxyribonuclease-1-like [Anarhichas minor]|uniref:deoxyribonuclease-1-like n=1 Tax=Anarhichas minor TaxID=65739 RepID=UPI003F73607B